MARIPMGLWRLNRSPVAVRVMAAWKMQVLFTAMAGGARYIHLRSN